MIASGMQTGPWENGLGWLAPALSMGFLAGFMFIIAILWLILIQELRQGGVPWPHKIAALAVIFIVPPGLIVLGFGAFGLLTATPPS